MFNRKQHEIENLEDELAATRRQADAANAKAAEQTAKATEARAEAAALRNRYNPPVSTRPIPSATESSRRRH